MIKYCYPKKMYWVGLKKLKRFPDGSYRTFIRTASLGKALYANSKQPVARRQIDVYDRSKTYGIQAYCI